MTNCAALKSDVERTLIQEYEQVEDARERIDAEREKFRKAQIEHGRERARRNDTLAEYEAMLAFEETKRNSELASVAAANAAPSAVGESQACVDVSG